MSFRRTFSTSLIASALAAAAFTAVPASAQDAQTPDVAAPSKAAPVDDGKVASFAVAFLQVDKISQKYKPKIENAGSKEERQKVQSTASQEMVKAVNGVDGMTVQEYSSILAAAKTDPKLARKISDKITETAGESK